MDNEKLAFRLAKEWLRSTKLTGNLAKMGFDVSDYRLQLSEPIIELLGLPDTTNEIIQILDGYEEKVVLMTFFDFMDDGLDKITEEMITAIKNTVKRS